MASKPAKTSRSLDACLTFSRTRLPASFETQVIERFFSAIDTPVALSCYLLWKHGEHDQLAKKVIKVEHYNSAFDFRLDFAAVSFLAKDPGLKTTWDTAEVAKASFLEAESRNEQMNADIYRYLFGDALSTFVTSGYGDIIEHARFLISKILGKFNIQEVFDLGTFGPGVTLSVKGERVASAFKYQSDRDITPGAYRLFGESLTAYSPLWWGEPAVKPNLVQGNKVVTVPKNAKTDRTIAIEPGLNSWIQLGIGKAIRGKLREFGYDLNDNTKNQLGAYHGSLDDSLATLDFRAASDSISYRLVQALLPEDWWIALRAARSPVYCSGDNKWTTTHKFSSMGCGFTFELESLIFLSVALACCRRLRVSTAAVAIFGDDVVLPREAVPLYSRVVGTLGFELNTDKSFHIGPFRESCGSYYYCGVDVKPFFKKGSYRTLRQVYILANSIRELSHRWSGKLACDERFHGLWNYVVSCIPKRFRRFGPRDAGDSVIHENLTGSSIYRRPKGGCEGYLISCFSDRTVSVTISEKGLLVSKLRVRSSSLPDLYHFGEGAILRSWLRNQARRPIASSPSGNEVDLRGVTRIRLTTVYVARWYYFGPWL